MERATLDERGTEWCFVVFVIINIRALENKENQNNLREELFQVETVFEEGGCLKGCWYRSWQKKYVLQSRYH